MELVVSDVPERPRFLAQFLVLFRYRFYSQLRCSRTTRHDSVESVPVFCV